MFYTVTVARIFFESPALRGIETDTRQYKFWSFVELAFLVAFTIESRRISAGHHEFVIEPSALRR